MQNTLQGTGSGDGDWTNGSTKVNAITPGNKLIPYV